ncbi:MAG: phage tail tape measure protein, partial [Clostridia bacterium]
MSNELKRVGLVFTQEGAVDFKKSLQEINLELNKNYNQFKLTQSQWDSSTKSTEKLRAEQEYLKNAYEIQLDKVSTLKMQLSDLENAENKNTTAIKKKRNELTNAEVKLETYNKKLKEIDSQLNNTGKKIEEFGAKVENVGNKIEGAGKKLSAFSAATATALVASAKSAIDFEDAFTGVEKTVDGTEEQMAELKQGIRDMAKELPSTTTEISAVAEAAGQLGIKTENILDFSKAMIDLGNSTNLTADEAASQLAKFANVMQMSQKDFDKLGSAIVDLGNNFATTEADIVAMSMRLAGAGKQVGLSEGQVLGLATALSSVGIEAEMGGSAISKAMVKMQNAVEQGGTKLNTVLKKTGMTL